MGQHKPTMDNRITWLEPLSPQLTSPAQHPVTGHGILQLHTPLHEAVNRIKDEIDRVAGGNQWDDVKKITNPYEYVFLSLQRRMHRSLAAIQPLSRSYFKMIELWDLLGLKPEQISKTAHTAEGPGGFLEAIQARTGHTTPMTAMTLRSTDKAIPGWRKSQAFLNRHPTIHITYGADGTGNLYNLQNQLAFASTAGHVDLYTADGGFDFSADFNGQENTVHRLLIAEALAGLNTLKPGGTMILKIFDTKNRATLELLWILANCFHRTGLVKLQSSRPANSERYWIGQSLHKTPPSWVIPFLEQLTATDAPEGWNQLFADMSPVPPSWLAPIQQLQEIIEAQQFNKIELTLNLIRTPSRSQVKELLAENIRASRDWCRRHRIPLNPRYEGLTEEGVVQQNLEEALAPFPALVGQKSSPTLSPQPQTHCVSSPPPPPRLPAAPAWRSALPPSVLGRAPSQTDGAKPPSAPPTPSQSPPASDHVPDSREPH
jgi:hypothetical protein